MNYNVLCQDYINYLKKHFGQNAIVVLDGYSEDLSTKDTAHIRRNKSKHGIVVQFTGEMTLTTK